MFNRKNFYRLGLAVITGIMCLSVSAMAYADIFYPDMTKKGSIFVEMYSEETKQPISGGTITMCRVGDYIYIDNTHLYKATVDFEGYSCYLDLAEPDLANELAEYAKANAIEGWTKTIDSDGRAGFLELETGLYLLVQREAPDGYHCMSPFLVTIPLYDETRGDYVFDIDATPKTQPLKKDDTSETEPPETRPSDPEEPDEDKPDDTKPEDPKPDDSGSDDQIPSGTATPSNARPGKASPSNSRRKSRGSKSSGEDAQHGPGVTEPAQEIEEDAGLSEAEPQSLAQTGEGRNSIIGSIIFAISGILLAITAGFRIKMRSRN